MKIKTSVKAGMDVEIKQVVIHIPDGEGGSTSVNHNQTVARSLLVKSGIKAAGLVIQGLAVGAA